MCVGGEGGGGRAVSKSPSGLAGSAAPKALCPDFDMRLRHN